MTGQHAVGRDGGPFRLGLIGAGRMGRTHLTSVGASSLVAVTAVAEPDPAARAAIESTGAAVFAGPAELLEAGDLDGVLIAVPTDRHVDVLGQVMAAGLPVLCEKPCGLSVEEAAACARIAETAGLVLQVAYWRRFVPALANLRQRMLGGDLGDILAVNCYQWDAAPPPAEFRGSSGGIFVDMGVHEFDQVRWLTGQEFTAVKVASSAAGPAARGGPASGTAADDPDCAQLVAELDGGSTALVSLGRWHPAGDSCRVEVFGTKGTSSLPFLDPVGGEAVFHHALRLQAEDFARSVAAGDSTGATIDDAVAALRTAGLAHPDPGPAPARS